MLIDSLFLVNKQHDTFAELAVWKAASDDTSLFSYLFQPPTTMLFFLPLLVASLLIFIHFWNSWSIWPCSWMFAFPRILEAPGYFAPRTQLKSAPAQTRWLRSRSGPSLLLSTIWRSQVWEPSQHRPPPPLSMPRLGLCFWVAPLLWQAKSLKKNWFLYLDAQTRVSSRVFQKCRFGGENTVSVSRET